MKAGDLLIYERTEEVGRPPTRFYSLYARLGTREDAERGRQFGVRTGYLKPDGTSTEEYEGYFNKP